MYELQENEGQTVMLKYRKIEAKDDPQIVRIIRNNLEKAHLDIPGTVYFDPELDHLSIYYDSDTKKRVYFVALNEAEEVIGGVGAAEFAGIPNCAELQKLYLETHTNLTTAVKMYEKLGFHQNRKTGCSAAWNDGPVLFKGIIEIRLKNFMEVLSYV